LEVHCHEDLVAAWSRQQRVYALGFRVDNGRKSPFKRIANTTSLNIRIFLLSSLFLVPLHHSRNLTALASQPNPFRFSAFPKASSDNRADATPFWCFPFRKTVRILQLVRLHSIQQRLNGSKIFIVGSFMRVAPFSQTFGRQ
jgi:hypothetical protein